MKFSKIKKNPDNPRLIVDERFEQLKTSIIQFPEMLKHRPIVVNEKNTALGGNMRFEGLQALHKDGFEEIYPEKFSPAQTEYRKKCYDAIRRGEFLPEWISRAEDLSPEQQKEFVIKDNLAYGRWDYDLIEQNFADAPLADWGFDFPFKAEGEDLNLDEFFKADDTEKAEKEKIILEYSPEEAARVRAGLAQVAPSPEAAVWSLLKL